MATTQSSARGFGKRQIFDWKREDLRLLTRKQTTTLALQVVPHNLAIAFYHACNSDMYDRASFQIKVPQWTYEMEFALNHPDVSHWIQDQSADVSSKYSSIVLTNAVKLVCFAALALTD